MTAMTKPKPPKKQKKRVVDLVERCKVLAIEAKESPPPQGIALTGLSPLEQDQMVLQRLLGGACCDDDATPKHPEWRNNPCFDWLNQRFKNSGKTSALLLGGTGCGKTWAMLAYALSLMNPTFEWRKLKRLDGLFVTAYQLSWWIQDAKQHRTELSRMERVPVLLLDDLGTEPKGFKGGDMNAHMNHLFDERHKFGRITLMSSNGTKEEIKQLYGERFASRFSASGLLYQSNHVDMRRKRL